MNRTKESSSVLHVVDESKRDADKEASDESLMDDHVDRSLSMDSSMEHYPAIDSMVFEKLKSSDEYKAFLNFLDSIEIDEDGKSFSYINSKEDALEKPEEDTIKSQTDSIFTRRIRPYSKHNTLDYSHLSNDLNRYSNYEKPKETPSFAYSGAKKMIPVIPPTDPEMLKIIANDSNKIITINGEQVDSITRRIRPYSKHYTPDYSHLSNDLNRYSNYVKPKKTPSFAYSGAKKMIPVIPPTDPEMLKIIANDSNKIITINGEQTDSITRRIRPYSKHYTPDYSHLSNDLNRYSNYEKPKETPSFAYSGAKKMIPVIPPTDPEMLKIIANDSNKIITINGEQTDSITRRIRPYSKHNTLDYSHLSNDLNRYSNYEKPKKTPSFAYSGAKKMIPVIPPTDPEMLKIIANDSNKIITINGEQTDSITRRIRPYSKHNTLDYSHLSNDLNRYSNYEKPKETPSFAYSGAKKMIPVIPPTDPEMLKIIANDSNKIITINGEQTDSITRRIRPYSKHNTLDYSHLSNDLNRYSNYEKPKETPSFAYSGAKKMIPVIPPTDPEMLKIIANDSNKIITINGEQTDSITRRIRPYSKHNTLDYSHLSNDLNRYSNYVKPKKTPSFAYSGAKKMIPVIPPTDPEMLKIIANDSNKIITINGEQTDSITRRIRPYSKHYTPDYSHLSNDLNRYSNYEKPKETPSFAYSGAKKMIPVIPPTDPEMLKIIANDSNKIITINGEQTDSITRRIRPYSKHNTLDYSHLSNDLNRYSNYEKPKKTPSFAYSGAKKMIPVIPPTDPEMLKIIANDSNKIITINGEQTDSITRRIRPYSKHNTLDYSHLSNDLNRYSNYEKPKETPSFAYSGAKKMIPVIPPTDPEMLKIIANDSNKIITINGEQTDSITRRIRPYSKHNTLDYSHLSNDLNRYSNYEKPKKTPSFAYSGAKKMIPVIPPTDPEMLKIIANDSNKIITINGEQTDSITRRIRPYSKHNTLDYSHLSNDLNRYSNYEKPKETPSFAYSGAKKMIPVIPPTDPEMLKIIANDSNKIITINGEQTDSITRRIRPYSKHNTLDYSHLSNDLNRYSNYEKPKETPSFAYSGAKKMIPVIPPTDPEMLKIIANDSNKIITINGEQVDSITRRIRPYSKHYTPDYSHLSNDLNRYSNYEKPKKTPSFAYSGAKKMIPVIPPTDPEMLKIIANDSNKIITINGEQTEIRFYNQTAITFMDVNDPREVYFQGPPVKIIIDDTYLYFCSYNCPDVGIILDYQFHKIHLGTPTRELYIDDNFYSCSINGPPIQCVLNNIKRSIKLIGDPPSIVVGNIMRQDLVAGISYIIVDSFHPKIVYLDAKPQCIEIGKSKFVLRFVDQLNTVLINNQPFKVDYGGEPLKLYVKGSFHFMKFRKLPPNVHPGFTALFEMLNIVPKKYTTDYSPEPSIPTISSKVTSKLCNEGQECKEKYDPSINSPKSGDSLSSLLKLQSDLKQQLVNFDKSDQMLPIIPSPKIHAVLPDNVNIDHKLPIENDTHQLNNNALYDPLDIKLEIAYDSNYLKNIKRNMSLAPPTVEPDILEESSKESIESNEMKENNHETSQNFTNKKHYLSIS